MTWTIYAGVVARHLPRAVMASALLVAAGCTTPAHTAARQSAAQMEAPRTSPPTPPTPASSRTTPPPRTTQPTSADTAPTSASATARAWERVLWGDGFDVWCDADGNARLTTDAWPWTQFPLPENALRRQMLENLAATPVPPRSDILEKLGQRSAKRFLLAMTVVEDLPKVLAQALRDAPPGPQRKAALDISKSLLVKDAPIFVGGILPIPYRLPPPARRALAEAVESATGPSTRPAE